MLKTEKVFDCPRCHSTLNIEIVTRDNAHIEKFIITENLTSHFEAILRSTYQGYLYHRDIPAAEVRKYINSALRLFRKLPKDLQDLVYRTIVSWSKDDFVNFEGIQNLMWVACKK